MHLLPHFLVTTLIPLALGAVLPPRGEDSVDVDARAPALHYRAGVGEEDNWLIRIWEHPNFSGASWFVLKSQADNCLWIDPKASSVQVFPKGKPPFGCELFDDRACAGQSFYFTGDWRYLDTVGWNDRARGVVCHWRQSGPFESTPLPRSIDGSLQPRSEADSLPAAGVLKESYASESNMLVLFQDPDFQGGWWAFPTSSMGKCTWPIGSNPGISSAQVIPQEKAFWCTLYDTDLCNLHNSNVKIIKDNVSIRNFADLKWDNQLKSVLCQWGSHWERDEGLPATLPQRDESGVVPISQGNQATSEMAQVEDDGGHLLELFPEIDFKVKPGSYYLYVSASRLGGCQGYFPAGVGTQSVRIFSLPFEFYCILYDGDKCNEHNDVRIIVQSMANLWSVSFGDRTRSVKCIKGRWT